MVLEHLFPANWLEKKIRYAFLLGFGFSFLSLWIAKKIFPKYPGIVSLIFLSLLLLPSMRKLFAAEEKHEEHEKRFKFKHLYKDNKHLIEAYLGVFFGIFFAYFIATFLLPFFGINVLNIVKEQLFLDPALLGRSSYQWPLFFNILTNNWWVLFVTFSLALVAGDGALFFIAWNASAWGAIFGYRALTASLYLHKNPFLLAGTLLGIVFWHVFLEGLAYILAAISGSVISEDIIKQSKEIKRFLLFGCLSFALFLGIDKFLLFLTLPLNILFIIRVIIIMIFLYYLGKTFQDKKHKEVFIYNYWLFVLALGIFILGGLIETGVLSWSQLLQEMYRASYLYAIAAP